MYAIFFTSLALIAAVIRILLEKERNLLKNVEILLLFLLIFDVGLGGLFAFFGHAFMADMVASKIGWPTGSPFQFEIAVANLSFGIIGILSIWLRGNFWVAAGLAYSVFVLGAAYGHIREAVLHNNFAPYNVGPVLYIGDILVPIMILSLLLIRGILLIQNLPRAASQAG